MASHQFLNKPLRRQPTITSCPGPHDVLQGRGGGTNNHCGNKNFRDLVLQYQDAYKDAPKADKPRVALQLVMHWRNLDPPGRFLAKTAFLDPSGATIWEDIGDSAAQKRVSKNLGERRKRRTTLQEEVNATLSLPAHSTGTAASPSICSKESTDSSTDTIDLDFIWRDSPAKKSAPEANLSQPNKKRRDTISSSSNGPAWMPLTSIQDTQLEQHQLRPSCNPFSIDTQHDNRYSPGPNLQHSLPFSVKHDTTRISPNHYFLPPSPAPSSSMNHDPFALFNQRPASKQCYSDDSSAANRGAGTGAKSCVNDDDELEPTKHPSDSICSLSSLPSSIPTAAYLTRATFGDAQDEDDKNAKG